MLQLYTTHDSHKNIIISNFILPIDIPFFRSANMTDICNSQDCRMSQVYLHKDTRLQHETIGELVSDITVIQHVFNFLYFFY